MQRIHPTVLTHLQPLAPRRRPRERPARTVDGSGGRAAPHHRHSAAGSRQRRRGRRAAAAALDSPAGAAGTRDLRRLPGKRSEVFRLRACNRHVSTSLPGCPWSATARQSVPTPAPPCPHAAPRRWRAASTGSAAAARSRRLWPPGRRCRQTCRRWWAGGERGAGPGQWERCGMEEDDVSWAWVDSARCDLCLPSVEPQAKGRAGMRSAEERAALRGASAAGRGFSPGVGEGPRQRRLPHTPGGLEGEHSLPAAGPAHSAACLQAAGLSSQASAGPTCAPPVLHSCHPETRCHPCLPQGYESVVLYLASLPGCLEQRDGRRETALAVARRRRQAAIESLLLEAGANPDLASFQAGSGGGGGGGPAAAAAAEEEAEEEYMSWSRDERLSYRHGGARGGGSGSGRGGPPPGLHSSPSRGGGPGKRQQQEQPQRCPW